jgi:23S rRNA (uracil1939-C5)-methyltransferase
MVALAAPTFVVLVLALRRLAPTELSGAGFAAGLAAGHSLLAGVPHVVETLAIEAASGVTQTVVLRHHVRSFFQANRYLVGPLAARVAELSGDGPVVDLYAGVGLFAVTLASRGRGPVVAVEGEAFSAADLRANAAAYEGAVETRRMPVERFVTEAELPAGTTVIVDPPRTGMSRVAMSGVLTLGAARVVYVSCDVATLARDLRTMVETGYRLDHIEAFDLFPNTAHVEGVAVLTRA